SKSLRRLVSGSESGDILVEQCALPELSPGDLIAMPAAGAYSPSMASNYNSNPRPPIVMVKDGAARLIRRRETPADLMVTDIW
ncbi:MAG: diaminopimelate decarboxylase, partial [Chloroflexota bacterium]|nr:diaminopimelate decarboxylase [Chloroflexota bacterium]